MANSKMVEATVAHGRTVFTGTIVHKIYDVESKRDIEQIKAAKPKGPGETVLLPEDEVVRLRGLGYLTDPKSPQVERQTGQSMTSSDGPQVKV